MATGLLVIRLSRPFAAKSAANWVMKREVFFLTWRWLTADICFGLILGLISTSSFDFIKFLLGERYAVVYNY